MAPGRLGTVERSVAAGAGVYGIHKLVGTDLGTVTTPFGKMDGLTFMAVLGGLSAAGEEVVRPYVPNVIGSYGGTLAIDATTRGVVPVVGYRALSGERFGWANGAKTAAITYAGSSAGMMIANQLFGR
jgi:hypothetical protein